MDAHLSTSLFRHCRMDINHGKYSILVSFEVIKNNLRFIFIRKTLSDMSTFSIVSPFSSLQYFYLIFFFIRFIQIVRYYSENIYEQVEIVVIRFFFSFIVNSGYV
jgi:hypothetical protein